MTSEFRKANARNVAEMLRLQQLIKDLGFLNTYRPNNSENSGWLWHWENNAGNGLSENDIERIKVANRARKAKPANYTINKLQQKTRHRD